MTEREKLLEDLLKDACEIIEITGRASLAKMILRQAAIKKEEKKP